MFISNGGVGVCIVTGKHLINPNCLIIVKVVMNNNETTNK